MNRLKWAAAVMANHEAESVRMLWFALAANKAADVAAIQGVTVTS